MAIVKRARKAFGAKLDDLRKKAGASFVRCGQEADVDAASARLWCRGEKAPGHGSTQGVVRLVEYLRREAGEDAGFDDEWRRVLDDAQLEAEDHRGTSKGRGEDRKRLARFGADTFTGRPFHSRDSEWQAMTSFVEASGDLPSYLWWQAPPEAGKSALLAQFVLNPPEGVNVVGYFLSGARGWNRYEHFAYEMAGQLTDLLGRKKPAGPQAVPRAKLQKLFQDAARRSSKDGRRLVIVVDSLDEDAAWRGGLPKSGRPDVSIAALLPHEAPSMPKRATARDAKRGIRVIVSSRPTAELPTDVPAEHPLRRPESVRSLAPVRAARPMKRSVRDELEPLGASEPGRAVMGLLAAAEAGLRVEDLAELTGVEQVELARLLAGVRGLCLVPEGFDSPSYVLGDEKLLRSAREEVGREGLGRAVDTLHAWADSWQARGWPVDTPRYLLSHYPRLPHGTDGVERFVLDPHRQSTLVELGRLDEARAQLELVTAERTDDLGVTARVAVSRALLTTQARLVPRRFPELFALAGDVSRARALALSAPESAAKAVRLTDVAVVLAKTGGSGPEAESIAREAVEWTERATEEALSVVEPDEVLDQLKGAGLALCGCGLTAPGRKILRAVLSCGNAGWTSRLKAAVALGGESTDRFITVAEHAEGLHLGIPEQQAEALEIWGELIKASGKDEPAFRDLVLGFRHAPMCVPRLAKKASLRGNVAFRQRVEDFCADLDPKSNLVHVDLLALAATVLGSGRRESARNLLQQAQEALLEALAAPEALSPADRAHLELELSTTLARVVKALIDVEMPKNAVEFLGAVPAEWHHDVLGDDVREPAIAVLTENSLGLGTTAGATARELRPVEVAESRDDTGREADRNAELQQVEEALKANPLHGRRLLAAAFARWEGHVATADARGWTDLLAGALAAAGHIDDAVRLSVRSPEPADRAGALAALSVACASGGHVAEAGRCAREAAEAAASLCEAPSPSNGRETFLADLVAQAFAHAGDADSAEVWTRGSASGGRKHVQVEQTRTAVAVGLAAHDPEAAARIVGEHLVNAGRRTSLPPQLRAKALPAVAELLLALPNPRRHGAEMCAALRTGCARVEEDIRRWDPYAVLVHALLDEGACCSEVPGLRGKLAGWERYMVRTALPGGVLPVAEWAVLHAFRGSVSEARKTAERAADPDGRAAALVSVAAYLAGVRPIVPATDDWAPRRRSALRFGALADALGTGSSRDVDEARRLVREVLAGEHWHHALPLLPRLAPEVLPQLAETALVHLRARPGTGGTGRAEC
ncbi:hypothetical protein [Streptomyces sp. NPDC056061]|uniref:hypothetical protein n=1 Tax=Streptomyces sp. NPDC056061 TaxID=3345700 RepID=UPI0035D9735C